MKHLKFVLVLLMWPISVCAQETITLASTTSTQNSGLYDHLLPIFTEATGIKVQIVAVGTGQALRLAQNGDADVLIVHHRPSEDAFVANGHGTQRYDIMYNDFVLIGPQRDPAAVSLTPNISSAFAVIGETESLFISRGDESGTHKKELEIWENASEQPNPEWYREIGAGMGAALNMASSIGAYTLSDRGTWLAFGNKGDLDIVYSDTKELRNPYGLIPVNPEKHPHVKIDSVTRFAEWMISPAGQQAIGDFRSNGFQLFCPATQDPDQAEAVCPSK